MILEEIYVILAMLITYLVLIIMAIYMLRRREYEYGRPYLFVTRKEITTPLAIIKALLSNILLLIKCKAMLLLVLSIFISVISAGIVTTESYSIKEMYLRSALGETGLYIKYEEYIEQSSIYEVLGEGYEIHQIIISRSPLSVMLDDRKNLMYLILIDCRLLRILNLSTKPCITPIVDHSVRAEYLRIDNITLILEHDNIRSYDVDIVEGESLFPILSYIGSYPIKPSVKSIVIVSKELLDPLTISNMNFRTSTIILCADRCRINELRRIAENLMRLGSVEASFLLINETAISLSKVTLPTPRSTIIALLAIIVAIVISVAVSQSLTPRLKEIGEAMLLAGTPTWLIATSASLSHALLVMASGLLALAISSIVLGPAAGFNSLVAFVLITIFSHYFLKRSIAKVTSRLETLPLPTDIIIKTPLALREIAKRIEEALRSDETFEVLEFKSIESDGSLLLKFELLYRYAVGIGLELEVILEHHVEGIRMLIYTNPWSVEDIGEKYLSSLSRIVVSKVIGVFKLCQLR